MYVAARIIRDKNVSFSFRLVVPWLPRERGKSKRFSGRRRRRRRRRG